MLLLEHYRHQAQRIAVPAPRPSGDARRLVVVAVFATVLGAMLASLAAAFAPPQAPAIPWQWNLAPVASMGGDSSITDIRLLSTLPFKSNAACNAHRLPKELADHLDVALERLPAGTQRHTVFLVAAGHDRARLRSRVYESNIALAQARSDCVARHIREHTLCTGTPSPCSVVNFVRSASDPLTEQGKVQDADRAAQILVLSREVSNS